MDTENEDLDPRLSSAIAGLVDREPDVDLWPGIAKQISPVPARPGMLQLPWPVAAAAAAVLMLGGATLTALVVGSGGSAAAPLAPLASTDGPRVLPAGFDLAEATLGDAIGQLEEAFGRIAPSLDLETRRAITEAIVSLDQAIADARLRSGADPSDIDAARYLTRTMQRKLRVLQSVTTISTPT